MQGFNRYYPPNYDPKVNPTLNSISGKHALGDRARKIDKGILIVRFELPFNIWCGGCNNHIGQGVRYNAEKRKVGNYYSTPIFAFRCKCHQCSHWFEIQTDPKNTRYVITEGAKQRVEEWDPAEAGGIVLDQKVPDKPQDAMESAEKSAIDKQVAETSKTRIAALADLQDERWSDPYTLSKKLRKSHRAEKRVIKAKEESDAALRAKLGLPEDLKFSDDTETFKEEARQAWETAKSNLADPDHRKRKRLEITGSSLATGSSKRKAPSVSSTSAKKDLATRLAQQTRQSASGSIFGSNSSSSKTSKALSGIIRTSK